MWFGDSVKTDSKKAIKLHYGNDKDQDFSVNIDQWVAITTSSPIQNSQLNTLKITFEINENEFIAFYDIAGMFFAKLYQFNSN